MRKALLLGVALAFAFSGLATAQETTSGSIAGRVVDPQGAAVPGATVTVITPQGEKVFTTDETGRFLAPFIPPGTHAIRVDLAGFKTIEQKEVLVRLGSRVNLTFTLEVSQVQEVVEVVGASPVIDLSSTTSGAVIDSELIKNLPVGRSLTQILYVAPGVSVGGGSPLGDANPSIGGASGLENNYIVDGVNITDPGFGGAGNFNPQYGSLGVGVTADFIKETQVKTAGFEAEYGQATGGVVNVVTRTGTNEFHGSLYGYFRSGGLQSSYDQLETPDGTTNRDSFSQQDFGVSMGGPLVKDKLFFFGTFNPQFEKSGFTAPEGFQYEGLGVVNRERKIYSYAGKLTWQASSNHRFDISLFGDPSTGVGGLQRTATLKRFSRPGEPGTTDIEGGFSELDYGTNNQTLRYDGIITPNWFVEASVGHADTKFNEAPFVDEWQYTDVRQAPFGVSGGLGYHERDTGENWMYSLKSTNIFNAGGTHQLRYGIQFEDIEFVRDVDYSGPSLGLADGQTTVTGGPIQIRTGAGTTFYRATRGKLGPAGLTTQKYLNFFAQDTWQIDRLTLRVGIRYEQQKLRGYEPGGIYPDLCFEDDSRPGAGDGSGAAIACNFQWDNLWSPRIGATYDLLGNGKTKLFGAWGRFYAKIPNDLAARSMSADPGITRQNFRDVGLTQPVPNGELFAGSTTHLLQSTPHASIIDPDSTSMYRDEILVGFEWEAVPMLNVGFRYVNRKMKSLVEDIGQLAAVGYFLDVCGDTVVDYFITNVNASTETVTCGGAVPSSFEDPENKYQAFEFTLNKNYADDWALIASYRYSKLEGNFEGFYRSDNGQTDPAISSLFDFPTNDPTYTSIGTPEFGFRGDIRYQGSSLGSGVLPNDRPHQIKVYGLKGFGNLNLGVGFLWGSGVSLTGLTANPVYTNNGEIPLTLRGEGFETVDGFRTKAPADLSLDLHVDYSIRLNDRQRIQLIADVFNVFNRQEPTNFDNFDEASFETPNPNYGQPTNGGRSSTASFQAPFALRLGARFEW